MFNACNLDMHHCVYKNNVHMNCSLIMYIYNLQLFFTTFYSYIGKKKRGTLRRKEGDGNGSTGEKEERKT